MAAPAQHVPESERLYRIGDVSRLTDTKPFVLRFWETEFPMLQPVKAPKGHRLYRQEDIDLIRAIKRLLYEEGFTIAGARRHLGELMANGEGLAGWLEGPAGNARAAAPARTASPAEVAESASLLTGDAAPMRVPERAATPARELDAGARTAGQLQFPAVPSAEAQRSLLAVREELRAILTLLGTQ
ncbi:MAG TPA: MerR family transcriptional regulator [Candidatus Acidoferrales bacterium]|nr:MerR family transcriptional regulator [Candidatus Acidoferrales bacterium]